MRIPIITSPPQAISREIDSNIKPTNGSSTAKPCCCHKPGSRGATCTRKLHAQGGNPPDSQVSKKPVITIPAHTVSLIHLYVIYAALKCSNIWLHSNIILSDTFV